MENIDVITKKLSREEIEKMEKDGYITVNVAIPFDDIVEGDIDSLNNYISELLFESYMFYDISYQPIAVNDNGDIIIKVTGNITQILANVDGDEDDDNNY